MGSKLVIVFCLIIIHVGIYAQAKQEDIKTSNGVDFVGGISTVDLLYLGLDIKKGHSLIRVNYGILPTIILPPFHSYSLGYYYRVNKKKTYLGASIGNCSVADSESRGIGGDQFFFLRTGVYLLGKETNFSGGLSVFYLDEKIRFFPELGISIRINKRKELKSDE